MKQYDSVPGVIGPFCKAPDVQSMADKILFELLYIDQPTIQRIEKIITDEGFYANTKRFDKMVKDNG